MEIQGLPPRVQDAEKADLCSQVLGIGRDRLQGIGGRPKQQVVQLPFILESQRGQFLWQCEHDVEVLALQ